MKKSVLVTGIVVLVIIVAVLIFYPKGDSGYQKVNVNNEVMDKYPALNDDKFYNNELTIEEENTINVNGRVITFKYNSGFGGEQFLYNNQEYTPVLAYDSPCPDNFDCGSSVYVVDFESFYLVYSIGDVGPRVFGPFEWPID